MSLLDGANRIPELVKHVKASGMDAIAVTDHGNMAAFPQLLHHCKEQGVKPIAGIELYVAPGHRTERGRTGGCSGKEHSFHLTMLAKNGEGVRNLFRLSSKAFIEGYYYKPRVDKELLELHSEGLICLSGCISSEFSDLIMGDKFSEARRYCDWAQKTFGKDFFIEIQNNGYEPQVAHMIRAVDLARSKGIPLVGTSDAHYMRQEDSIPHDIMLCINTGARHDDVNRMRFSTDQFYVKNPTEMLAAMPDQREALERTQEIADSIEDSYTSLEFGKRQFPSFEVPSGTVDSYLRELCLKGLSERYEVVGQEHLDRLNRELKVISKLGFSSYFLILWDVVRYARSQGIPCIARGSACGAITAYSLYISSVCPLRYRLLFERFLDESRAEAPDIDIDICTERRAEIYQYVVDKYGEDRVCQIGTYGTLSAKSCIADVGRVLGMSLSDVKKLKECVPETLHCTIESAIEQSEDLRKIIDENPLAKRVIDMARRIEGIEKSAGTHAAGVVVCNQPIMNICPLQRLKVKEDGKSTGQHAVSTQWAMGDVEKSGLLKMDFLGLRNLTIMEACRKLLASLGTTFDQYRIPMDDPGVYAMMARGETKGVFQLESSGMRELLIKMQPDVIDHIIAIVALYRPGPLDGGVVDDYVDRRHGRKVIEPIHSDVDSFITESYGLMIYQEDIMQILNKLGGIPLTEAYKIIKAIAKKKLDMILSAKEKFISGCADRGINDLAATMMFEKIEKFCLYGFNKSHAAAYADLAYKTAYLKHHYPREYMTCLLSSEQEGANREKYLSEHILDCRRMDIEVLCPDVNRSGADCQLDGDVIRLGLSVVKGIGRDAAEMIAANQPYGDILDLFERSSLASLMRKEDRKQKVTGGAVESLIHSGALDSLGKKRSQWLAVADTAMQHGKSKAKRKAGGQTTMEELLGEDTSMWLPPIPELPDKIRYAEEKRVLGFYMSGHPLNEHRAAVEPLSTHRCDQLDVLCDKSQVILGGMISSFEVKQFAHGGTMVQFAPMVFDDFYGSVRAVAWSECFYKCRSFLGEDRIGFIVGKVRRKGDDIQVYCDDWVPIEEAGYLARCILVKTEHISSVASIVKQNPGQIPVYGEGNDVPRTVYLIGNVDPQVSVMAKFRSIGQVRLVGHNDKPTGPQPIVKRYLDNA
jgi:DNA polymerase-3 subunit alpha